MAVLWREGFYGHLRREHSFAMIKRVCFGNEPPAENIVPLPAKETAGNRT
jgi:hypothetical protein